MKKLWAILAITFTGVAFSILTLSSVLPNGDKIIDRVSPIDNMPLLRDTDPQTCQSDSGTPNEQRGPEFRRFLAASVRINVDSAFGSGTIVYYDYKTKEAYIASCGHLWGGTRSAESLKKQPKNCTITIWYQNNKKLDKPKNYPATVLFWSTDRGYDSALLKFKPDWEPAYYAIAPVDYQIAQGSHQHSVGCDGARETAHYDIEIVGRRGSDLVTTRNSPRPGRSGGGLLSNDWYYIGTCWGTSNRNGSGIGYFTPLSAIYSVYKKNGYEWILSVPRWGLARQLKIHQWKDTNRHFDPEFILIPGQDAIPVN